MPLLDKLNSMWLSGSIKKVHEEFVGRILKKKIIQEICKLENQESICHSLFLLFLAPDEKQELNQYFVELFIRKNRFRAIELGADLMVNDLMDAVQTVKPKFLFTIIHEESSIPFIDDLVKALSALEDPPILLLTGYCASQFQEHSRFIKCLNGFDELEQFIQTLSEFRAIKK